MKIRHIQFFRAVSPISRPIADSTHSIPEIAFIVTRITLDSGVTGEAYLLAFHYSQQAIAGALRDIAPMAMGWDVNQTEAFIQHYEKESEYFGNKGIHRWALGSINIAMWDARAKSLNVPVLKMFGTHHSRVPLYGSGGWLSYSIPELLDEVTRYVTRGFRAVKIKVGSPNLQNDIERLTRVREAVGPHIQIMMDANQGMNFATASQLSATVRE